MLGFFKRWFRPKCSHVTYYETMACDAVCVSCGKKLGFIGDLRQDYTKVEEYRGQPWR